MIGEETAVAHRLAPSQADKSHIGLAIDKGNPAFTSPPFFDQRGFARVFHGRLDIGAVESDSYFNPVNSVPGAQTVDEDAPLPINAIVVTDDDGNLATTQLSVANGTMMVTLAGSATISAGANESSSFTL